MYCHCLKHCTCTPWIQYTQMTVQQNSSKTEERIMRYKKEVKRLMVLWITFINYCLVFN